MTYLRSEPGAPRHVDTLVRRVRVACVALLMLALPAWAEESPRRLRIATFNIEDVRTEHLVTNADRRLQAIAAIIQHVRPDVILLNEIAYDNLPPKPGQNGQRLVDQYLATPQGDGLEAIRYRSVMAPSNTGLPSGFDLNRDGETVSRIEDPADDAQATQQSDAERSQAYGNDCWGYGTFPGQYAMALLVREGLTIDIAEIRTFQRFPWSRLPGALRPRDPLSGESWYSQEAWAVLPLSSKSHWDVPVRLADGQVIHILCSHPTPPVFDGDEDRNGCRNHDEIRFWAEYLNGAAWIVDDAGRAGGLAADALFVLVGDLNADPEKGDARGNPVGRFLLTHPRIQGQFIPQATGPGVGAAGRVLDSADTASWGLRVDYVLPARELIIAGGAVVRDQPALAATTRPSDHFLVWLELEVPKQPAGNGSRD